MTARIIDGNALSAEVRGQLAERAAALKTALFDEQFRKKAKAGPHPCDPFNDAKAGERIAQVLATVPLTHELIQKRLSYAP